MCSAAYSASLRTSRTSGGSGAATRAASSSGSISSILRTGRSSVRQAVIPPSRKPRTRIPTAASSSAASRSSPSEAATTIISAPAGGDAGDLGREAGVVGGGAEGAGDVGLVELLVGAAVDDDGAGCDRLLDLVRGHRRRGAEVLDQRPAVEGDDLLDVGRLVAERADRVLDELGLVGDRQRRVVAALEADRRGGLEVDRRAAAERAAEVARPDLDLVVEHQQALVQGAEHLGRTLARLDREVGPGDVADEQRVAAEQRPGGAAAAGVAQQEGGVLGPVAGRVDRLDPDLAQLQHPAVGEGLVRVLGAAAASVMGKWHMECTRTAGFRRD